MSKQNPILAVDSEVDSEKIPFEKSRKRTSLEEFAKVNKLRSEIKAGFKVWLKGQYYHFDDEWKRLFEEYKNR